MRRELPAYLFARFHVLRELDLAHTAGANSLCERPLPGACCDRSPLPAHRLASRVSCPGAVHRHTIDRRWPAGIGAGIGAVPSMPVLSGWAGRLSTPHRVRARRRTVAVARRAPTASGLLSDVLLLKVPPRDIGEVVLLRRGRRSAVVLRVRQRAVRHGGGRVIRRSGRRRLRPVRSIGGAAEGRRGCPSRGGRSADHRRRRWGCLGHDCRVLAGVRLEAGAAAWCRDEKRCRSGSEAARTRRCDELLFVSRRRGAGRKVEHGGANCKIEK